jgi:hypothetical protein
LLGFWWRINVSNSVTPHSLPEQIAEDLFVVYGSIQLRPLLRITRNMAVVRHADELTLINAVRMNEGGLQALDALGEVKRVMRLGPFHGRDDGFYVERYGAQMWGLAEGTTYTQPPIDQTMHEGEALPFPHARLFVFDHMVEPEGVILLEQGPGILLTVDSIQSYSTPPHMPHTSKLARLLLPLRGFPDRTIIGPVWMQTVVTDRAGMRQEFQRLLQLEFDQLLSGHGVFLQSGAKAEVQAAFDTMFGKGVK